MNISDLSPEQFMIACNAIRSVEFQIPLALRKPKPSYDFSPEQRVGVALSTCATIGMLMQQRFPDVMYRCSLVELGGHPIRTNVHVFTMNSAPHSHILAVAAVCKTIGNLAAAEALVWP